MSLLYYIGHPVPHIFQSSPFMHTSRSRKSFTIPQSRKYSGQEPLINPPSPEVPETQKPEETGELDEVDLFGSVPQGSSSVRSSSTIRSTNSTTFSESSVESRISTRLCPEDATYPRGGLLGLADCMSSRGKNKSS